MSCGFPAYELRALCQASADLPQFDTTECQSITNIRDPRTGNFQEYHIPLSFYTGRSVPLSAHDGLVSHNIRVKCDVEPAGWIDVRALQLPARALTFSLLAGCRRLRARLRPGTIEYRS